MEIEAAKVIGAGLAVIGVIGSGIGIGNIFSSFIQAVGRNPAARSEVFTMTMLGFAGVLPLAFIVALTGLEILIAFLQAYVFAILTCLYINDALHLH